MGVGEDRRALERIAAQGHEHGGAGGDVGQRSGERDGAWVPGATAGWGAWYEVYPAMNSSEISAVGAGPAGDDGVAQFVEQREAGDRAGQPHAELVAC